MQSRKRVLFSTTVVPLVVFAGVAATGLALCGGRRLTPAQAQCAPKKVNPCAAAKANPCAAAKRTACAASKACAPCNPCAAAKACSPCNPCAAAKAGSPCNPCAAACGPCSPCSPCAAACGPCSPCSPCAGAGGAVSQTCVVPRLQQAAKCNPCAVAKPCSPCSPCAAAQPCSPCNPCAAAQPCSPCNPCAAAQPCSPCSPCAAAQPCGPCAPCSPCGAGEVAELTDAEAVEVYDCLIEELKAAYAKSDHEVALSYMSWPRYSTRAYVSATHGNRYVQNYVNPKGRAYGAYEDAGRMPAGAQIAKDSFTVTADGRVMVGPLFVMEKMEDGFNPDSDDWRYTMIMADGSIFGVTKGRGSDKVEFCVGCHMSVAPESDSLMLLPEEYRVQ